MTEYTGEMLTNAVARAHENATNFERERLRKVISEAGGIIAEFARQNPRWTNREGVIQDPFGAHAWLKANSEWVVIPH